MSREPAVETDQRLRVGRRGYPLLPGGFGRSTLYMGAPSPLAVRGEGHRIWDDQGRELIDASNNFTTLIHGHAHPEITEAAERALRDGACFGLPNALEWEHAELMLERLPTLDQVRYACSGTEAVMSALRIARAATGRDGVVVALGAYHGTSEVALVAGGEKYTRGVARSVIDDVAVLPVNDVDGLRAAFAREPERYAAILVDLLPNRAGLVPVSRAFVEAARELATRHGALLIIDEVISLRLGPHGLSGTYGVEPDLLTAGKIIGGGFPIGAVLGRGEVMRDLDPRSPDALPHSGTFWANPVTMAAGAAALRLLTDAEIDRLGGLGDALRRDVGARVAAAGWEVRGHGSLARPFPQGVTNVPLALQHRLWWAAYERGLLLWGNGVALSTPMTAPVARDIGERLADAILAVADAS